MKKGEYEFCRVEFAGSLGDLGTLIPLSVAMIVINGINATAVFLLIGLFYIGAGLYYKLPIPVQPLKAVAAIAIASGMDAGTIAASGYLMGIILLFIAATGIIDALAKFFTKPIVRGIQLGLGLILISKGIEFIGKKELLINGTKSSNLVWNLSLNTIVGMLGVLLVILLLTNKRLPAAIAVILFGLGVSAASGAFGAIVPSIGFEPVVLFIPDQVMLLNAFILLVIPQIPLTIGNAIIGTADTARSLFGEEKTKRTTFKSLSTSMGLANIASGALMAMPMCHGAGGLAAHYRFGARTGGSNLMIGAVFVMVAVVFGKIAISLFGLIPNSILGVLLLFAGIELAMLINDVTEKKDLFVAFLIAGIALATTNMGIAFIAGMAALYIIEIAKIEI
ncbi:putative sulfate/molybdate transporter [archaeon]|nr:putative sulfate/molybdate transporter [archaeon]